MKYELLALFPLTATDAELKAQAGKIEERLKTAGANIVASTPLLKERLAYGIGKIRQGYYHTIQFEIEPSALAEFQRALILSGEVLRFDIAKVKDEFKPFTPSVPREMPAYARLTKSATPELHPALSDEQPKPIQSPTTPTAASKPLIQEKTAPTPEQPKVSMEELDKRLEEILGE